GRVWVADRRPAGDRHLSRHVAATQREALRVRGSGAAPARYNPHMASLSPGAEFAGYVIEQVIGRGGMGVIYRARETQPERPVAIKVIAPDMAAERELRARFLRAAHRAASIDHPHGVPLPRAGDECRMLYLAM